MTQRSELQQRVRELKAQAMNWVANRLFSFKESGLDGFLKRQMLGEKKKSAPPRRETAPQ